MAGVTSVLSGTGYSASYVSNSLTAGNGTAAAAANSSLNASKQLRVKKDSDSFDIAIQDLKNKLKIFDGNGVLADLYDDGSTSDSFRVLVSDSVDQLVKAYNKVNDIIKSSKYVTGEGSKLLDDVQTLIGGVNAENYRKMGLEIDKQNSMLKFDEKKFAAFFDDNLSTTQKLLMNNNYLADVLDRIAQSVLNKQSGYYFIKSIDVRV